MARCRCGYHSEHGDPAGEDDDRAGALLDSEADAATRRMVSRIDPPAESLAGTRSVTWWSPGLPLVWAARSWNHPLGMSYRECAG